MDLKALIQTGITQRPPRVVLHGPHGIGKSTWAAKAPKPIFIQTEDGLDSIGADRFPVAKSLDDVWQAVTLLLQEEHDYKTVVIDTADWLERLVWAAVCAAGSKTIIEDFGYGKGYVMALGHWERFFRGCDKLREKGLGVVVLAHTEVKTYNPPDTDPYDRYQIKLHRHAAANLEEWADAVLFATQKIYVKTDGSKNRAVNTAPERVVYTDGRPAWRAKNRYGLPFELPLDFAALMAAMKKENDNG